MKQASAESGGASGLPLNHYDALPAVADATPLAISFSLEQTPGGPECSSARAAVVHCTLPPALLPRSADPKARTGNVGRNYLFTDKDDDRDPTGGSATWTCGQSVRESSSKARRAQRATALSFLRRALRTQPCFTPAGFINNRPRGEATAMLHKGNDDYLPL